jgi:hypothetical protein
MYRIRRFAVMKTATVVAIMYMLIVGVFVVPFGLLALLVAPTQGAGAAGAGISILLFGLIAIFAYGLLGWVFTAVAAAIYNLAARWVGGIEVEIETVAPPPPLPVWGTTAQDPPPTTTVPPPPATTAPPPPATTPPAPPSDSPAG